MGYRKYAKDYEIEYVNRIGKKRPEAVRIYVGPYFRFSAPEKIPKLKKFYLIAALAAAVFLILPMCFDCTATRTWYVQLPAAIAWIPWVLGACSVWRLWSVKDKAEREHYDMMYQRMSGSSLFMVIFGAISFIGSIVLLITGETVFRDFLVSCCCLLFVICGVLMFLNRKGLEMTQEENPEKPMVKK